MQRRGPDIGESRTGNTYKSSPNTPEPSIHLAMSLDPSQAVRDIPAKVAWRRIHGFGPWICRVFGDLLYPSVYEKHPSDAVLHC